jgi:hypothetical protein
MMVTTHSTHEREILWSEAMSSRAKGVLSKLGMFNPEDVAQNMSKKKLRSVPGCGPDTASEIQDWVMSKGYFLQDEDLSGIPLEKLEQQREIRERELAHIVARIAVLRLEADVAEADSSGSSEEMVQPEMPETNRLRKLSPKTLQWSSSS